MQSPSYNSHQKRFVSNAVLYALHMGVRTDVRPDNPENRLVIIGATPTGKRPNVIDESRRLMGSTEGHEGLKVPPTALLITWDQLHTWRKAAHPARLLELDQALALCQSIRSSPYIPLPRLWDPVEHSHYGWYTRAGRTFRDGVRTAALELLQVALDAGNVKTLGAG